VKPKSVSRLGREPVELRAAKLKVLIILTTGIPENAVLFGIILTIL
jgi:hypothetical protein